MADEHGKYVPPEARVGIPEAREEATSWRPVEYEGCSPDTPKGGVIPPDSLKEAKALVTDTGAYTTFLDKYRDKETFTDEEIDDIYRESIRAGIVDHHSVDQFFASKGLRPEKYATKMVADYADTMLELIDANQVETVKTHFDADLDAVASSYLTRALIQNRELPLIAGELADVTNKIDYGRFGIADPDAFTASLPGFFGALKAELSDRARAEIAEKGFNPAILGKYENLQNKLVFDVLNALNDLKTEGNGLDLGGDISAVKEKLDPETVQILESGQEKIRREYEQFLEDYENATFLKASVATKDGGSMQVDVVVGSSENPLSFTNLAYTRSNPETIVAVFAGNDRKSGDNYDIGILPDQGKVIDLKGLCLALNKAERKKRDAIMTKAEGERTSEEQQLVDTWEEQRAGGKTRDMFPDIKDMIARGEVNEDDILDIDPTPLVAGDSLIPASRTSLLSKEEFQEVLREFAER